MKWGLAIANQARRAMRDMPPADAERIDAAFVEMREDPYSGDVKFLRGTDHELRRRVGDWRIRYHVERDRRVIVVDDVERRNSNTY